MGKLNFIERTRDEISPDWAMQSKRPGYRLERLNSLAFPKGKIPLCEITGLPSTIQMITPYLTLYFATREDAYNGWESIMHKLCPLLGPLRSQPPIVGSEEERVRRKKLMDVSLRALVDLTKGEASKFLEAKKYKLAIPAALQTLKLSFEAFGDDGGNAELLTSYILLAEAHLGLGNIHEAEEYLSKANIGATRNEDECTNVIKERLHRNLGKLFLGKKRYQLALKHAATGIYFSASDVGPEHIRTAVGYFGCATIFFAMRRIEQGLAFYDKVVDIWYKYLASLGEEDEKTEKGVGGKTDEARHEQTKLALIAADMILEIYERRKRYLGETHIATGEAVYTLGLVHLFLNEHEHATKLIAAAAAIYTSQLGKDHPSTKDVERALEQAKGSVSALPDEK